MIVFTTVSSDTNYKRTDKWSPRAFLITLKFFFWIISAIRSSCASYINQKRTHHSIVKDPWTKKIKCRRIDHTLASLNFKRLSFSSKKSKMTLKSVSFSVSSQLPWTISHIKSPFVSSPSLERAHNTALSTGVSPSSETPIVASKLPAQPRVRAFCKAVTMCFCSAGDSAAKSRSNCERGVGNMEVPSGHNSLDY